MGTIDPIKAQLERVLPQSLGHDRYQPMLPLAKGGMGSVYLVADNRREKKVALKILKVQASRSMYRLNREFRAIADDFAPNRTRRYLDFGILREIDNHTKHYAPIGTPNYMSPEKISREPVTPAADMYAFGCLL